MSKAKATLIVTCSKHPKYQGKRPPRGCAICLAIWESVLKTQAIAQLDAHACTCEECKASFAMLRNIP